MRCKKIIAALLVLCMTLGAFRIINVNVMALDEKDDATIEQTEEETQEMTSITDEESSEITPEASLEEGLDESIGEETQLEETESVAEEETESTFEETEELTLADESVQENMEEESQMADGSVQEEKPDTDASSEENISDSTKEELSDTVQSSEETESDKQDGTQNSIDNKSETASETAAEQENQDESESGSDWEDTKPEETTVWEGESVPESITWPEVSESQPSESVSVVYKAETVGKEVYEAKDGEACGSAAGSLTRISVALEGIENLEIKYRIFNQTSGWTNWASNGEYIELDEGIEAVQMILSGSGQSKYALTYSVQNADGRWTAWTGSQEIAGVVKSADNTGIRGIKVKLHLNDIAESQPDESEDNVQSNTEFSEAESVQNESDEKTEYFREEGEGAEAVSVSVNSAVSAINAYPNQHENTGNAAADILAIAQGQAGYTRPDYSVTKYGQWYGNSTGAWCAMFVSWCANQAGIPKTVIKPFASCNTGAQWFKSTGKWKDRTATPKAGDIIFFHQNRAGNYINHVGIVTGVGDGYVYTIEGNTLVDPANELYGVHTRTYKLNDPKIVGYGVPNYSSASVAAEMVQYKVHARTLGWLELVKEGQQAGTTGQARRIEAIRISKSSDMVSGNILYRVHVKSNGWLGWTSNGATAGTTGEYRRMEAIEIKLDGAMSQKYDIYYRVHIRTHGWLGWAKNGEPAGSTGMALRMEAIQIELVEKGGSAPGSTANAYLSN